MLQLTPRFTGKPSDELIDYFGQTLAHLLAGRGVQTVKTLDTTIDGLLSAEHLLGIDDAVNAIDTAIDQQKRLLVVGDFDCDGATSTALMMRVLSGLGAAVQFLIPDRFVFGYGLTPALVEHAYNRYSPDMIITVDNGISSHDGVDLANRLGIDVVITDHHLTKASAPKACAVVNPNQLGCSFASKALVGVGVAFYVLGRLAKKRREAGKSTYRVSQHLDLVALGTVADVGVLDQNNRILVTHGLAQINAGRCSKGILAILAQAKKSFETVGVQELGFIVAPRINAAGRMDSMDVGVACLLADDDYEAQLLAGQLDHLNNERRQTQDMMKKDAEAMLNETMLNETMLNQIAVTAGHHRAVILYDDRWHQGVIGVVAGRIKEQLHLPTLIFAPSDSNKIGDKDLIKASARSITGVHMQDSLVEVNKRYPELICHFGGHAMAAGLTLYKENFERFCCAFYEVMNELPASVFCEQKITDGHLLPSDISLAFADSLSQFLWGQGFLPPVFDGVFGVQSHKILKDKHLKFSLSYEQVQYPIDAIWFNFDNKAWDYRADRVHILYKLAVNEWQGNRRVQLIIQDLAVVSIV